MTARIGFVGVGTMGQCAHLRNYAAIPECEVTAIAEIVPELGQKVAKRYGVPRVYVDFEEMLATAQLDGIVAIQPFNRHGLLLPALLKPGKPVFTEKPLCGSVGVGETLLRAVEKSGAWHMVGYHKRHDPAVVWAMEKIGELRSSNEWGAMRYIRITMPVGDWIAGGLSDVIRVEQEPPPLEFDPPPADMDEAAYADYLGFVNYYIHQVNLLRYLFGESYKLVFADKAGRLLVVESESGLTGTIEMDPYTTTRSWDEKALVAFEKGYIEIDFPAPLARNQPGRVVCYGDPGGGRVPSKQEPTLPPVDAMRNQAQNFVDSILGKCRPRCEASEAFEDLKIARDYVRLRRE